MTLRKKSGILFILLLLLPVLAFSQGLPSPVGFVNDFAGVIDQQDEARITRIAQTVKRATGAEIAVVTVPSYAPYGSIEEYSIDLASEWEIGEEGEDNGILLLLAMEERETRIEVGYGLEGAIPDGLAGEILDKSMIPSFRNGAYSEGLRRGAEGVAGIIAEEYDVDLSEFNITETERYSARSGGSGINLYPIIVLIFILLGGGRFIWPLLFIGMASGRRGHYGGGFGSRSGFSGGSGFGGFSGGGFGGGGASRGF